MQINKKWVTLFELMVTITILWILWVMLFFVLADKTNTDKIVNRVTEVRNNVNKWCFEIVKTSEWVDIKRTADNILVAKQIEENKIKKASEFFWGLGRTVHFSQDIQKSFEKSTVSEGDKFITNWIYLKWDGVSKNDVFYVENQVQNENNSYRTSFRCWYWIKMDSDILSEENSKNLNTAMEHIFWKGYEKAIYTDTENKILYFMIVSPYFFGGGVEDLKLPKNIIDDVTELYSSKKNTNSIGENSSEENISNFDNKTLSLSGELIGSGTSVEDYIKSLSLDEICTKWQLWGEKKWKWAYSEKLKWCIYANRDGSYSLEWAKSWVKVYYEDQKKESSVDEEKLRLFGTGELKNN